MGLIDKLKNNWNKLSLTGRLGIRSAIAMTLVGPAALLGVSLLPVGGLATVLVLGAVAVAGCGIAGLQELIPSVKNELRHGQDLVEWTNAAGQKVRGTVNQRNDLTSVKSISPDRFTLDNDRGVANLRASNKLAKKFYAVAEKVTILNPEVNGNKYRFPTSAASQPKNK